MVLWRGIMSTKITHSTSRKNSGHDFASWRGNLKLLPRRRRMMPFHRQSFCLQFNVMNSCFILSKNLWQKHQPRNRTVNRSTPLSRQFCDSRLRFVVPNSHTILSIIRHHIMVTLPRDTESSLQSFIVVIRLSFRMSSSARWSNVRVNAVVARPERRVSLSSAVPFSEPAISEEQRRTVLLSTTLTTYCSLLVSSLPQELA